MDMLTWCAPKDIALARPTLWRISRLRPGVIGAFGLCNYICLALRPPFRAALSGGDGFDREGVMAAVLVFTSVLGVAVLSVFSPMTAVCQ